MRNHRKIKALRNIYGSDGYSVWCMMLEILTHEDGFRVLFNENEIEFFAGDFGLEAARVKSILEYCIRVGLFQVENSFLYSDSLLERLEVLREKRAVWRRRKEEKKVKQGENPQQHTVIPEENPEKEGFSYEKMPQTKLNQTKLNQTKVLNTNSNTQTNGRPSSVEEVKEFWEKFRPQDPKGTAVRYWNHYRGVGFVDGNGNPIVNWQAHAMSWNPNGRKK